VTEDQEHRTLRRRLAVGAVAAFALAALLRLLLVEELRFERVDVFMGAFFAAGLLTAVLLSRGAWPKE
jgi:hypothetical protein